MAFTDAEKVEIRHYCGFPAYGVAPLANFWMRSTYEDGQVEFVMRALSADEEAIVRTTYLANLRLLEADIPATRANIDTSQAAVWTRNKNELLERITLFDLWRKRLCSFIGSYYGPELMHTEIRMIL
jgi:hypothetical protein